MKEKKIILSGIQPSGSLCIANYLGAMKNWVSLQDEYESIFLIVDLHSITVEQIPAELRKRCLSFTAQYLACGINPKKSLIAIQSHIHQHTELMWVFSTISYMGELSRMTQFKDKSKQSVNTNVGLYSYPILMASDILLYQADLVPVGADQKQHIELARNLAVRFNSKYSETFKIPEPYIPKDMSRIMSLQNPENKMSKSDQNLNNIISLLDTPDIINNKIKRAVTDSNSEILPSGNSQSIMNLLTIFSGFTNKNIDKLEKEYAGHKYSMLKKDLSAVVIEKLSKIQDEYYKIISDKQFLLDVLKESSIQASRKANKTISKVYRKIGLVPKIK